MSKPMRSVFVVALAYCLLSPSAIAEVNENRVDTVTVYPDRARVSRVVAFNVAGDGGEIVVEGLPADLRDDSIRVTPMAPASLMLADVRTRVVRGRERVRAEAGELEERIETLEARGEEIDVRLEALALQLDFLRNAASQDGEQSPDWTRLTEVSDALGENSGQILTDRLEARRERQAVDAELERLRQSLDDLGAEQRDTTSVVIGYQGGDTDGGRLQLDYVVPNAGWRAAYDLRLATAAEQIDIAQQARVRQDTGEDWREVTLFVSTSQPALGGRVPRLNPWFVDAAQAESQRFMRERSSQADTLAQAPESEAATAELMTGDFSAEYRVPGRVTVAADGDERAFALSQYELPVDLAVRTVPARAPHAWLFATGEYDGDAPMPGGSATLYRDGVMVARTHVEAFTPGSEMALGFGVDQRVTVSHELTRDTRGDSGFFRKRNHQERAYVMTVNNGHDRSMPVTVLDRMPVSKDERIEVNLMEDALEPDRRDIDDRPGIVAWDLELEAGESRTIRFGYSLSYPEEIEGLEGW